MRFKIGDIVIHEIDHRPHIVLATKEEPGKSLNGRKTSVPENYDYTIILESSPNSSKDLIRYAFHVYEYHIDFLA